MIRIFFLLAFLISNYVFSKNLIVIQGQFSGLNDNINVALSQYNFEDKIIAVDQINKGKCIFNNLPELQEGVYQLIVNYLPNKSNNQSTYFFNIIIDKTENDIEFNFSPKSNQYPTFIKSEINKNWYNYLNTINFRLAAISELKRAKISKNNSPLYPPFSIDEILENELKELEEIRSKFISDNKNKWSTNIVKNSPAFFNLKNLKKEDYWGYFEIENTDLINTPIFQELIQNYIIRFYNNSNEEQYKLAFQEVIDVFSKNEITREWVVKYVITGLYRIENNNLSHFFSKKYNYKI